jgi:predicted metalloprotease
MGYLLLTLTLFISFATGAVRAEPDVARDRMAVFLARILGSTEVEWSAIFAETGQAYQKPTLVLFTRMTDSVCGGVVKSEAGPMYCENDSRIFIDPASHFGGCSFEKNCSIAIAFVIAHEVGHHVQSIIGHASKGASNEHAVPTAERRVGSELQADCLAGIWANRANKNFTLFNASEVEQALSTAIGFQLTMTMETMGTPEQRKLWFAKGFGSGALKACNISEPG